MTNSATVTQILSAILNPIQSIIFKIIEQYISTSYQDWGYTFGSKVTVLSD